MSLEIIGTENLENFTTYKIRGQDSLGRVEISRRYKEFLYLREMIAKRYPGLVIPQIPPKVYMNRANEVIEERQRLLNHFLQTICMHTYFAQMPEI